MTRLGPYELIERIGSGTMGTVWRARQREPVERDVAVKRLLVTDDPAAVARLRREAEALAALDHPNIVRILELVPDGEGLAIVMPLAVGGSLAESLRDRGRLAVEELARVVAPVADALSSAHRRGVVHRDVKPSNIVFTVDGDPLLTDFGIARLAGAAPLTAQDGSALGTAEYLDPAVAAGGEPDALADQYALGILCWEALAGRHPYASPTPLAVLRAADEGERRPLAALAPQAPPALVAAIERASARDPEERFADVSAFGEALRAAVRQGGVRPSGTAADPLPPPPEATGATAEGGARESGTRRFGPQPPRSSEEPDRARRNPGPAVLAVLAVIVVGLLVWTSAQRGGDVAVLEPTPTPVDAIADPRPTPRTDCPPLPDPPEGETQVLRGDLNGDGCESWVVWDGAVAEAALDPEEPPQRYSIGEPGDELVLGDWTCDGIDTPALYRPTDGRVFLFDGWAAPEGQLESFQTMHTEVVEGEPSVTVTDEGCDTVEVRSQRGQG